MKWCVTDVVALFRDGANALMNPKVASVGENTKHTDPNREESY